MSDSIKKRFAFKLSSNLVGLLVGLATQAIIPRGLGPKAYGDFSFLTDFFGKIVNFLDMGTSTCFFNKLSQRPNDSQLISFYFSFSGLISFLVILFVAVAQWTGIRTVLWPGYELQYVFMASLFAIFLWISGLLNTVADAYGATVATEKIRMLQKILGLVILLSLYVSHQLQLTQFFLYNYAILFFLIVAFVWVMSKKKHLSKQNLFLSKENVKKFGAEFYKYSHPLFWGALAGNAATMLDRWWLQIFAGSEQQGFYGFAYLIGAVFVIFANSMQPLIAREFAINFTKNDFKQMAFLFRRYVPFFYSLAAFFSCLVVFQAENIILIMGGGKYLGAKPALVFMAFFTIHQVYGQLSGSLFAATDQTILMSKMAIVLYLIGIPATYFLVAPQNSFGLNFGAAGLAFKMVLIQFLSANVQLFYNARMLRLNFWKYVGHQFIVVICFLSLAFFASFGVAHVFGFQGRFVLDFVLSGIFYVFLVASLVFFFPRIIGLTGNDLDLIVNKIKRSIAA
ncbi:MAG: oligosaccharide flippase family protein [Candidatus Omnitrophota bacterium]